MSHRTLPDGPRFPIELVFCGLVGIIALFVASFVLLLNPPPAFASLGRHCGTVWAVLSLMSVAWIPLVAPRRRPWLLAWVYAIGVMLVDVVWKSIGQP